MNVSKDTDEGNKIMNPYKLLALMEYQELKRNEDEGIENHIPIFFQLADRLIKQAGWLVNLLSKK